MTRDAEDAPVLPERAQSYEGALLRFLLRVIKVVLEESAPFGLMSGERSGSALFTEEQRSDEKNSEEIHFGSRWTEVRIPEVNAAPSKFQCDCSVPVLTLFSR